MASTAVQFTCVLFRIPGKGGWTFAPVPEQHAPHATHAWGRTPVTATVDGHRWKTSVWRERSGHTVLAIPKAVRGTKGHGDRVKIRLEFNL